MRTLRRYKLQLGAMMHARTLKRSTHELSAFIMRYCFHFVLPIEMNIHMGCLECLTYARDVLQAA